MAQTTVRLRVIPLGGLDGIGKNMTVLEYGDDMVVIDAGIMFPDDDHPGVDLILPDFSLHRGAPGQAAWHRHHPRPRGPHGRPSVSPEGP